MSSSAVEIESLVSADRMFRAAILDWHNLGPKIAPEVLTSGTGEGNLRQLNFTSVMPFTYVKERMDFVDQETFECKSTITEGGPLGTRLESASIKYKIVDATNGEGSVVKVETTVKLLPGVELDGEAAIDKGKDSVVKHFKTVEAYLLANPDKYYAPRPEKSNIVSVNDDVLEEGGGGGHSRNFGGNQENGIVFDNATQQYGGQGQFGGVQINAIVIGNATQQSGGGYGGGGGYGPQVLPGLPLPPEGLQPKWYPQWGWQYQY